MGDALEALQKRIKELEEKNQKLELEVKQRDEVISNLNGYHRVCLESTPLIGDRVIIEIWHCGAHFRRELKALTFLELSMLVDQNQHLIDQRLKMNDLLNAKLDASQDENESRKLIEQIRRFNKELRTLFNETSYLRHWLHTKSDAPMYPMNKQVHGVAVIIVNREFTTNELNLTFRKGALKDKEHFQCTFQYLGYKIEVYEQVSSDKMVELMATLASRHHDDYDSFVCCVSTHGSENHLYGCDGIGVDREEFQQPIKNCRSLAGKPKLFFFQACRTSMQIPEHLKLDKPVDATFTTSAIVADVLVANATVAGSSAYTSPQEGSWFAQSLKRMLTDPSIISTCTLQQVLQKVNDEIVRTKGQLMQTGEGVKQCVEITTTLRKSVKYDKSV